MEIIPYTSLYVANHGWLQSRFHFSFAEYFDRHNMHYGVLRVMNDDRIAPHSGFGTHPHQDMEIITYVIQGELTHQDSMGNAESIGRGAVQYLSAGTGITHSEKNEGEDTVHLIQIWILPEAKNLEPRYGSRYFDPSLRHNRWLHLVGKEGAIAIYQDANIYVSELTSGQKSTFMLSSDRQCYLKIMEGSAIVNSQSLHQGDAAKLDESLEIKVDEYAHILLIEMPQM